MLLGFNLQQKGSDLVDQVSLRRVELVPFMEEVITSVNSTVLLSTTVRLNHSEFAMCNVSTVRVTTAISPLLLKKLRPSMSAVMSPTSLSSMQNVYLVVSCPSQSSSLCSRTEQWSKWELYTQLCFYGPTVCQSMVSHMCFPCNLTFCSTTSTFDLFTPLNRFTFIISARPGPIHRKRYHYTYIACMYTKYDNDDFHKALSTDLQPFSLNHESN